MGLEKIAAKRKELDAKYQEMRELSSNAAAIAKALGELKQKQKELNAVKETVKKRIEGFDSKEPAFLKYKESMLRACEEPTLPVPSADVLNTALKKYQDEIDEMVQEYVKKMEANTPTDIKPGMVFRNNSTKGLITISAGPTQSPNKNLTGDKAIFFDYKDEKGAAGKLSKADLKPGGLFKYIKV
jgi:DNA repair exonuclease SbcCD ATPase subunit